MDFTTDDLRRLFAALADRMARERDALCVLDGAVGDGDHGIAMEQGMQAASRAVQDTDGTLQDLWMAAAKGFLNAVGASSGPLYATGFMRAARVCGAQAAMPRESLRQVIAAIRDGIVQRGKAAPGQKTMIDVWTPAADAALAGAGPDAILAAAQDGVTATCTMVATLGRAARLGDRSLGHPDPGAASAAMVIDEILRSFR
jgi:phosphoenolpyruvate---glycerone phosphotransferase subunit DhaL